MTPRFAYFDVPADMQQAGGPESAVWTVRDAVENYGDAPEHYWGARTSDALVPVEWFIREFIPSYVEMLNDVRREEGDEPYPFTTEQVQDCARACATRGLL